MNIHERPSSIILRHQEEFEDTKGVIRIRVVLAMCELSSIEVG